MFQGDVDAELRRLTDGPNVPHRDAARHATRFHGVRCGSLGTTE
jgi:hypothetical protein